MNQYHGRVRGIRSIGLVLVWCGAVLVLFVAHQIWGTAVSAARAQDRLGLEFNRLVSPPSTSSSSVATTTLSTPPTAAAASEQEIEATPATTSVVAPDPSAVRAVLDAAPGDVIARIAAPAIGLDQFVVEGTAAEQLQMGPGHYRGTSLLGTSGNSGVAGHRTTYGAPFADIDRLRPGDLVSVLTPLGAATYEVIDPRIAFDDHLDEVVEVRDGYAIVRPEASFVLADTGDDRLTLTACHPRYSTSERIVVVARLLTPPLTLNPLTPPDNTTVVTTTTIATSSPETVLTTSDGRAILEEVNVAPAALDEAFEDGASAFGLVLLFALLTLVVAVGITAGARRFGPVRSMTIGLAPVLLCLWGLFEHLHKMLPIY